MKPQTRKHTGPTMLFTFILFSFTIISSCQSMITSPKRIVVTERHNDSTISMKIGDTLVVRLDAKPGTGYGWQVVKTDSGILRSTGGTTFEGGTEQQLLHFVAVAKGASDLLLHYIRPWEKEVAPEKVFRIEVQIQ